MLPSGNASVNLLVDLCANRAFGDFQIEVGLKSKPEIGRDAEVLAQSQRSIGGDSTLPITIALIRPGGTAISRARRLMLIPIGFMNSSKRISPG
jgi:hypothetical protein